MKKKISRLEQKFTELRERGEKALIPFITAGDPSLRKTEAYVKALLAGGADIIELGMPFSDPMADGPVIQAADERALKKKTNLQGLLKTVHHLRNGTDVPIVLMGYYNPIFHYGVERFARDAGRAGVDGCLIADIPEEESHEVRAPFRRQGLDLIYLLAPTSNGERIEKVARHARGYLYYVSMTGITGASLAGLKTVEKKVRVIKKVARIPVAVGFGIKTPSDARAVARFSDGVVIGSAFVKAIGEGAAPRQIQQMAQRYKRAISKR